MPPQPTTAEVGRRSSRIEETSQVAKTPARWVAGRTSEQSQQKPEKNAPNTNQMMAGDGQDGSLLKDVPLPLLGRTLCVFRHNSRELANVPFRPELALAMPALWPPRPDGYE